MTAITKPMLAGTVKDTTTLKYPLAATYKLDGIRCLKPYEPSVVSRTFKPIANKHISELLSNALPVGIDGEIMSGSNFQEVTHSVMSSDGTPEFVYNAFDYVVDDCSKPYMDRMVDLQNWYDSVGHNFPFIKILIPEIVNSEAELLAFEEKSLSAGYEGVILRSLTSPYKNGRATLKEHYLLKLKRFSDSECTIIGFEEQMLNNNVATKDAFGRTERSSHMANLVGKNTLGALIVEDVNTKLVFKIGTGLDDKTRQSIWDNRPEYLNQIGKYKFFSVGVKDLPRHPVWLGIRSKEDM